MTEQEYNSQDVSRTAAMYPNILLDAKEYASYDAYKKYSLPLISCCIKMNLRGVLIDKKKQHFLSEDYTRRLQAVRHTLNEALGDININSSRQMRSYLFGVCGYKPIKITEQNSFAVDADVLRQLYELHPENSALKDIIHYRHLVKMIGTYVSMRVEADGRVHPTWVPWGTVSWRLACKEPNLQNIPSHGPDAELRTMFVPLPGNVFVHADYSQVEFRMHACVSGDKTLLGRFAAYDTAKCEGASKDEIWSLDPHVLNASAMYQKHTKDVTQSERNRAKTFIYATMYGGTPESIVRGGAQGITRENTNIKVLKEMSDRLLLQFPVWVTWRKLMMKEARHNKLLRNVISGAPRMWFTSNGEAIEREAADYCGQGHAAVLMNRSHAEIERYLTEKMLFPGIIIQGHDSLTAEVHASRAEEAKEIIQKEMQRPIRIKNAEYTFPVDIKLTQDNWLVATKG